MALAFHEYYEKRANIDMTGSWEIEFEVVSTAYRPFMGLRYTYKTHLLQNGKDIEGSGEKWWENGVEVPAPLHTAIKLKGASTRERVVLTYELKGAKRDSIGSMTLEKTQDLGVLKGTFDGTAAEAKGVVRARRTSKTP